MGTESSVETAELISISPDSALVDSQGYTPARNGETLAMDTDRRKYTEGIGETLPADIVVWRRGYQDIIVDPTHTTTHAIY